MSDDYISIEEYFIEMLQKEPQVFWDMINLMCAEATLPPFTVLYEVPELNKYGFCDYDCWLLRDNVDKGIYTQWCAGNLAITEKMNEHLFYIKPGPGCPRYPKEKP